MVSASNYSVAVESENLVEEHEHFCEIDDLKFEPVTPNAGPCGYPMNGSWCGKPIGAVVVRRVFVANRSHYVFPRNCFYSIYEVDYRWRCTSGHILGNTWTVREESGHNH